MEKIGNTQQKKRITEKISLFRYQDLSVTSHCIFEKSDSCVTKRKVKIIEFSTRAST